jgi:hypothetical protein
VGRLPGIVAVLLITSLTGVGPWWLSATGLWLSALAGLLLAEAMAVWRDAVRVVLRRRWYQVGIDRLFLVKAFDADWTSFRGNGGVDIRIYVPGPFQMLTARDIRLGTAEARPFLGIERGPTQLDLEYRTADRTALAPGSPAPLKLSVENLHVATQVVSDHEGEVVARSESLPDGVNTPTIVGLRLEPPSPTEKIQVLRLSIYDDTRERRTLDDRRR